MQAHTYSQVTGSSSSQANSCGLDLIGLDTVCRLIDTLHQHDVQTDDSANVDSHEDTGRLNHEMDGMRVVRACA
jgi:hypothetical protein